MCCTEQLQPIVEELLATREPPPEGEMAQQAKPLELRYGPAMVKNPLTGELDVPLVKNMRQIMVAGMRIGYVVTDPGGAVSLLRPWTEAQQDVLKEAILEELALNGFDVEKPRRFSAPQSEGLLAEPEESEEETSPILMP